MMEFALFQAAAVFYAAGTVLGFVYLFNRGERWSLLMYHLLCAGVALHLASAGLRLSGFWAAPENRFYLPINSFFGALSALALAIAGTFIAVEGRHRLGILGAFVLPWACVAAGAAVLRGYAVGGTEIHDLAPLLRSPWMHIHPLAIMVSYALLGNAFGVGLALLIQERQLRSKRPQELCYRLPSLLELDSLNCRLIAAAFPILAAGIVMGGFWAHGAWGSFWGWDAKQTWALITASIYAVFLGLRLAAGWGGRKAVYISMCGFACVLFTFIGAGLSSELHGHLSGR
jgi:cytochrome c-type biogenesis protein CcsB